MKFPWVVIDQATQATEPERLLPMLMYAENVILVGDHKQLSLTVLSPAASAAGYYHSMFERLINLGNTPHALDIQYRIHYAISEAPNSLFYKASCRMQGTIQWTLVGSTVGSWEDPFMIENWDKT